ncbi:MAG: hypothetical protein HQK51_05945, partial [Oligoflexia bacterium]|nr:hypothetical protein [Oligoflexia bacterium]
MNLIKFYNLILSLEFIFAVVTFILLFFIKAPYGRHIRKGWGTEISNTWGWVIMEFPACAVILICFLLGNKSLVLSIFFIIWEIHYLQRTFIFPFLVKSKGKKMPLTIVFSSVGFNLMNGFVNGYFLFFLS